MPIAGLQQRAISVQAEVRKLLVKRAVPPSAARLCWAAGWLPTQIEQHPTCGCIDRSDSNNADTEFFAAGNHIIAAIRRLKFA